MIATQNEAAAALRRAYAIEWFGVASALTAIDQLIAEDFPAPDSDAPPTRYDLDAVRALRCELSALVEGWERVG